MVLAKNGRVAIKDVTKQGLIADFLMVTIAVKEALVKAGMPEDVVKEIMETSFRVGVADDIKCAMDKELERVAKHAFERIFWNQGW